MAQKSKKKNLTLEKKLEQALVPKDEQPYEIPDNWVWVKLEFLISIETGKKDANFGQENGKYPFFTCAAQPIRCNEYSFEGESLLLPGNGANVGLVLYYDGLFEAYQRTYVLQSLKEISLKYLYYHLIAFWENYNKDKQYGSATNYIKIGNFEQYLVPLPPYTEQQLIINRIESLFEKLDRAKELAQSTLDSFETRKVSIIHKAFKGKLTTKWRKENNISLEDWKNVKLQDICTINPPKINVKDLPDNIEVTFIPMPSVSDILGIIINPQIKTLGKVRKGYTNFCENDVIFAKITPCMENGKCAVVDKLVNHIGFGSTEFHVLRCGEHLNNKFLYYIVRNQSFRDEAKAVMTGAVGQQRVPKSFLEKYPIYLPSIFEQQEIVRILDNLFVKKQRIKELCDILDKIDLIKKSILAKAFRGELGTNDPTEESAIELLKQCLKDDE